VPQAHPAPGEFKDFEIRQSWKKMFSLAQVCALFVVTLSSAVCSLVQVCPSGHDIIPGTAAEADEDKTPSSDLFFETASRSARRKLGSYPGPLFSSWLCFLT